MMRIEKFSLGVGDRFAHQAKPQLRACLEAMARGMEIIPVWNKSNREHAIVGSEPASVNAAASAAVLDLGWSKPWYLAANHTNLNTADRFVEASDFYTIVGDRYLKMLDECEETISRNVTRNLFERHIQPLFLN